MIVGTAHSRVLLGRMTETDFDTGLCVGIYH
jgi:hypothetical protein